MDVMEMLEKARDAATVRLAFGEPITCDGVTVIPAARVGRGGGGGNSRKEGVQPGEGSGGGFGVGVTPTGVFVIRDGAVRLAPGDRLQHDHPGWSGRRRRRASHRAHHRA